MEFYYYYYYLKSNLDYQDNLLLFMYEFGYINEQAQSSYWIFGLFDRTLLSLITCACFILNSGILLFDFLTGCLSAGIFKITPFVLNWSHFTSSSCQEAMKRWSDYLVLIMINYKTSLIKFKKCRPPDRKRNESENRRSGAEAECLGGCLRIPSDWARDDIFGTCGSRAGRTTKIYLSSADQSCHQGGGDARAISEGLNWGGQSRRRNPPTDWGRRATIEVQPADRMASRLVWLGWSSVRLTDWLSGHLTQRWKFPNPQTT